MCLGFLVLATPAFSALLAQNVETIPGSPHDFVALLPEADARPTMARCAFCHTEGTFGALPPEATNEIPYREVSATTGLSIESAVCVSCHSRTSNTPAAAISHRLLAGAKGSDHPVSVRYDDERIEGFNPEAQVLASGLKFFYDGEDGGPLIECATCHNPHDVGSGSFLRVNNDRSALCLTCHIK